MLRKLMILIFCLYASYSNAQDSTDTIKPEIPKVEKYAPASVILFPDTLFTIESNLGPFSPADRAFVC